MLFTKSRRMPIVYDGIAELWTLKMDPWILRSFSSWTMPSHSQGAKARRAKNQGQQALHVHDNKFYGLLMFQEKRAEISLPVQMKEYAYDQGAITCTNEGAINCTVRDPGLQSGSSIFEPLTPLGANIQYAA
jgi:hypothetical protein